MYNLIVNQKTCPTDTDISKGDLEFDPSNLQATISHIIWPTNFYFSHSR